jgi:hypothetical protein
LISADGTAKTEREIDDVLSEVDDLRFYQVQQTRPATYQMKVVVEPKADAAAVRARAGEALRAVVGGGEIRVDLAKRIYNEPSLKFRFVKNDVAGVDKIFVPYADR